MGEPLNATFRPPMMEEPQEVQRVAMAVTRQSEMNVEAEQAVPKVDVCPTTARMPLALEDDGATAL